VKQVDQILCLDQLFIHHCKKDRQKTKRTKVIEDLESQRIYDIQQCLSHAASRSINSSTIASPNVQMELLEKSIMIVESVPGRGHHPDCCRCKISLHGVPGHA
jgi:hypothetical protein